MNISDDVNLVCVFDISFEIHQKNCINTDIQKCTSDTIKISINENKIYNKLSKYPVLFCFIKVLKKIKYLQYLF